jgi:hypothetical protein
MWLIVGYSAVFIVGMALFHFATGRGARSPGKR